MRLTKNVLTSFGAVALALVLVNAIAPQAVHAAVAALVQISNTATNPALTSRIDDPGRVPYQAGKSCNGCTSVTFGPVPANHRLVVGNISGQINFFAAPFFSTVSASPGGVPRSQFFPPLNPALNFTIFDQPVNFYVDQNQSVTVTVAANTDIMDTNISVTGYLLDCNAAPCAAVASF
jgi:hypothetical protein